MGVFMKRRDFLKTFGLGLGAAVINPGTVHQTLATLPKGAFAPAQATERDPAAHVISRLTFGVTPELYTHVRAVGAKAFIAEQLSPEHIDDAALDARMDDFAEVLNQNGGELARQYRGQRAQVTFALVGGAITRALYSERQLYERMVHFFSDHFSIFIGKGPVLFYKVDDDRDTIRPYALGRFGDILSASAHSPAMLLYLDNARSDKSAPNENYARELLELHTLGVNGGYTEQDVKAVARCFTGWSVAARNDTLVGASGFRFRRVFHDTGTKTVLGTTITNGGERDGQQVLAILASHPSTACFISTKLVRRFVADQPPAELVEACAAAFNQSQGDIRAVLRVIFNADAFWQAPPKFKQPFEYTMSLLRALGYDAFNNAQLVRGLRNPLTAMGQVPFTWPAPNGFPDVQGAWDDNLLPRWNMAIAAARRIPGAVINPDGLANLVQAKGVAPEVEPTLIFMAQYLLGRDLSNPERDILLKFAQAAPGSRQQKIAAGSALLLASPAFQYK
jgi:uncharacterized protein (DUF1800 family)